MNELVICAKNKTQNFNKYDQKGKDYHKYVKFHDHTKNEIFIFYF